MTTTNRNRPNTTSRWTPRARIARRALVGMLLGAGPGLLLVLLAEYVVAGEMQLTVGAPGLLLAVVGAVAGLVSGALTATRRWSDRHHGR